MFLKRIHKFSFRDQKYSRSTRSLENQFHPKKIVFCNYYCNILLSKFSKEVDIDRYCFDTGSTESGEVQDILRQSCQVITEFGLGTKLNTRLVFSAS